MQYVVKIVHHVPMGDAHYFVANTKAGLKKIIEEEGYFNDGKMRPITVYKIPKSFKIASKGRYLFHSGTGKQVVEWLDETFKLNSIDFKRVVN